MTGRLIDLAVGLNHRQRVTIEIDRDFREDFDQLKDVELDVEIKKRRKKRSLYANSYCWTMLEKLADMLHSTKEELYIAKIKEVGIFRDFTLAQDEAKTFCVVWSNMGTGWPTEQVDFDRDGDRVVIRAYYGSSTYNTKQMSRLIDSIVQDCREQGIETLTPRELSLLKDKWGGKLET